MSDVYEVDDTDLSATIDGLADLHALLRSSLRNGTRVEASDSSDKMVVMHVELGFLMCGLMELRTAIANLRRLRRETEERAERGAWGEARWMDRWDR